MKASVYFVGAGPGDPELLTRKALRVLCACDVVLHDSLVSQEILDLIPRSTRVISVGKRCGRKLLTQDDINGLLIHYASAGNTVVRLKGGDPLIFGRCGEEIEALRAAGVGFEVVPGVTCALAAAAGAGMSLTQRGIASHVLFTTAHRQGGKLSLELGGFSVRDTTIVVYMPGNDYRALSHAAMESGLYGHTPCMVVSSASRAEQQTHRTTLEQLADADALPAPALIILGDVAGTTPAEIIPQLAQAFAAAVV